MHDDTFDTLARRAATLTDRRSLFGGLSAGLLATSGLSLATEAKKKHHNKNKNKKSNACKKRIKLCNRDLRDDICEGNDACLKDLTKCCKKACKSDQQAIACCENAGWCG